MNFILLISILASITSSYCETTEDEVTGLEKSLEANSSMPPMFDATASKLVQYRMKAPPSYYRYKTQEYKRPRPRIKIPKPKFNPHPYSYAEPSSYYKQPEIYTSTESYKPSYSYDEIHYEVSSEYPNIESIPLSSYEAQAMDLHFYEDSFPKKKTPHYEYPKPRKTYSAHRPHKSYGLPKEVAQSSYGGYPKNEYKTQYALKPTDHYDESYQVETPKQKNYGRRPQQNDEYEQFPPYGAAPEIDHQTVEISFHVPESEYKAPVNSYHPNENVMEGGQYPLPKTKYGSPMNSYQPQEEQPTKERPYPVYDKKLPNAGYAYNNHFAEPPTDIHITYSPSYEINPLPPKYNAPQNSYEPPPSGDYGPPESSDSYHQPSGGHFAEPPESYLPPKHQQDELPLVKNHMPPGYDYPKSSYEVPIYDPIPFDQRTPEQDYFPPNHNTRTPQHEHASESINNIQQISPQNHPPDPPDSTTTITTTTKAQEPISGANKKVHRFVPNKYRTNLAHRHVSTSKVPEETETTQSQAPSSNYLDKILSSTSTFRPRRKRKRTQSPATEKHNLDVPELKNAFEYGHDQSDEPKASSSNVKEEQVNAVRQNTRDTSPVQRLTEFSPSQSWNPMRIRTKQALSPRGQRTAETALNELKNIEVLSIEKSHSHSYYAGTVPPRTINVKSRADEAKKSTIRTTTFKAEDAIQPTRSLVFDQTYFKVKGDDADTYDGTGELPKNHKLF